MRNMMIATVVILAMVASASAACTIDWAREENIDGAGNTGYTLTYNPSPAPAEFLNLRLTATVTSGIGILDPNQSASGADCSVSTPIDTFVNSCYSAMGWGAASYIYNAYKPAGPGHGDPPVSLLDWSVYDSGDGDTADYGPYVMARLITSPDTVGTITFLVYDQANIPDGETFEYPMVPEPATMGLLVVGGVLGLLRRRR